MKEINKDTSVKNKDLPPIVSESSWVTIKQWGAIIKKTEVYQIYFIRAQQKNTSRLILYLFCICIALAYGSLISILNKPIKFDELKVFQGYFEGYHIGGRYSDTIMLKNEKGKVEKFTVRHNDYETEKILRPLKGELIKVRFSVRIHPFLYREYDAEAIEYRNKYLSDYDLESYKRGLKIYYVDMVLFSIFVIVGLLLLRCVYRRHRAIISRMAT